MLEDAYRFHVALQDLNDEGNFKWCKENYSSSAKESSGYSRETNLKLPSQLAMVMAHISALKFNGYATGGISQRGRLHN
jgi:hypothetical protein